MKTATNFELAFVSRVERQYRPVTIDQVIEAKRILKHARTLRGTPTYAYFHQMIALVRLIAGNRSKKINDGGIQIGQILRMMARYLSC